MNGQHPFCQLIAVRHGTETNSEQHPRKLLSHSTQLRQTLWGDLFSKSNHSPDIWLPGGGTYGNPARVLEHSLERLNWQFCVAVILRSSRDAIPHSGLCRMSLATISTSATRHSPIGVNRFLRGLRRLARPGRRREPRAGFATVRHGGTWCQRACGDRWHRPTPARGIPFFDQE